MSKNRLPVIVLAVSLSVAMLASQGAARTWNIQPDGQGDAPTIQAGVDSAADGDIVLLAAGDFSGVGNTNVTFRGKAITVTSAFGATATRIDCKTTTRAFLFESGEGPSSVLSGVTIFDGRANFFGGAVLCRSSSPTIRDNIFELNASGFQGGAVYCDSSSAFIANNEFWMNQAPSGGGLWCSGGSSVTVTGNLFEECGASNVGGAMACNASAPLITDNVFLENGAQGQGGALDLVAVSAPLIQNNVFEGNQATSGGAIRCDQSSPMIMHNTFEGNIAGVGGGIFCDNVAKPTIQNNTFDANFAAVAGAGVYCNNFSDAQIYNTIIVGSVSGRAVESANFASPEIGCSNIFGNAGGDALPAGSDAGGNISTDPLFCKGDGNYYLQRGSPCAGTAGCGSMGAFPVGCGASEKKKTFEVLGRATKMEHLTWGAIKWLYHKEESQ